MHAATHVWEAAGRPGPGPARGEGACALCGASGPWHGRIGDNFTDYRLLAQPLSPGLCAACAWAIGGRPPNSLRMWTVAVRWDREVSLPELRTAAQVEAGDAQPPAYASGPHLHATNRRDMRYVAHVLADPPDGPWLVAVAESGQKHTAPFATVNHGAGRWTVRLDGADVTSDPAQWRMLLGRSALLRAAGFPAAEVEALAPGMNRIKADTLPVWREHAAPLRPYAGTQLLHLANLMITKEHGGHYVDTYPAV